MVLWLVVVLCVLLSHGVGGRMQAVAGRPLSHRAEPQPRFLSSAHSFLQTAVREQPKDMAMQQKFDVDCQCTEDFEIPASNTFVFGIGECGADEVQIALKESGEGMSQEDVLTSVGNPFKMKWAKVVQHHLSDIDGRSAAPVLGTPGGDIGEFISALSVYEQLTQTTLLDPDCERMLRQYLAYTQKRSFYLMTDTKALTALATAIDKDDLDLNETPDGGSRDKILENVVLPQHNGSKFLKELLQRPTYYNLRNGLAQAAIKGFFEILWDKETYPEISEKLRLVESDGENKEEAVVLMRTNADCTANGVAPMVVPKSEDFSMAIVTPDAANVMRRELSTFMATLSERIDAGKMYNELLVRGEIAVDRCCKALAGSKPLFEVTVV